MINNVLRSLTAVCCVILSVAVSFPSLVRAANADVGLNQYRIRNTEKTVVDWGQPYTLDDGEEIPASITYNGETYIHISLAGEVNGNTVQWNGDTATYTMTDYIYNDVNLVAITTREDAFGNIWQYKVMAFDGVAYLIIEDENRGYSSSYKLFSENAFEFAEDAVWFIPPREEAIDYERPFEHRSGMIYHGPIHIYKLTKIYYDNDLDTQDGTTIPWASFNTIVAAGSYDNILISSGIIYYVLGFNRVIFSVPIADVVAQSQNGEITSNSTGIFYNGAMYSELDLNGGIHLMEVKDGYLYFRWSANTSRHYGDLIDIGPWIEFKIKADGTDDAILLE